MGNATTAVACPLGRMLPCSLSAPYRTYAPGQAITGIPGGRLAAIGEVDRHAPSSVPPTACSWHDCSHLDLRAARHVCKRDVSNTEVEGSWYGSKDASDPIYPTRRAMQAFFQGRHLRDFDGDFVVVCLPGLERGGVHAAIGSNVMIHDTPIHSSKSAISTRVIPASVAIAEMAIRSDTSSNDASSHSSKTRSGPCPVVTR